MKPKNLLLISTLLFFGLLISACSSAVYSSTGWHGMTASSDTVYLAAGTQVFAVDLNTHSQKWVYPQKANAKITFYANPVLTADGTQLIVPSYDYKLYSLNPANSGSLNWTFSGSTNRLISSPLVVNNVIYQPSSDGNIYAVDLTGKEVWKASAGGPIWAAPATNPSCNCIYIASMDHKVYSFDAATGQQIWVSPDLGGSIVGTPAVGPDGSLYVGSFGKELLALDGSNGSIKWRYSTHDWIWSGPALANNVLYFGDLSGYFYALNTADGSPNFSELQVNNPIVDTPLVSGNQIYFTAESDTIYIVDMKGSISSRVIGGTIYSAPIAAGDSILLAPTNFSSQLVAMGPDGTQKWVFPPPK